MRRVCVVVTARPSYSRIKTALDAIRAHPELELQLVIAASALLDRYGSVIDQIVADGFSIDAQVYMVIEGENPTSMAKTTGLGIMELATAFYNLSPDVVVTVADRYETIATALAAAYMNLPVAHVQGGEVTGSIDEKVRHAVTKLSDLHFVATDKSRERLLRMGESQDAVFVTGCPSIDLAAELLASVGDSRIPGVNRLGVGDPIDLGDEYLVVLQHPVTSEYAQARFHIEQTLGAVASVGVPALWFWPNVDAGSDGTSKGIRVFREAGHAEGFHFIKNLPPLEFLSVMLHSRAIVGNSSVAIREGSYLGVPAVNIGTRQRNRERGRNVIDVDYEQGAIAGAIRRQIVNGRFEPDPIYGDGKAGHRIAELLATRPLTIEKQLAY
jgi:UDP-hydrolysing UDP-N-acetyl-D-glucosamine 2-epimerase